jgi:hypothetical protein
MPYCTNMAVRAWVLEARIDVSKESRSVRIELVVVSRVGSIRVICTLTEWSQRKSPMHVDGAADQ